MQEPITRTQAASKNLQASVAGIVLNFIFSFVSRRVFVLVLGKDYVGLGSLVGNITVLLTLLDFGASSAVIYRLYRPLSRGDMCSVSGILAYYNRLCRLSFVLTLSAGLVFMPYVPRAAVGFTHRSLLFAVYALQLLTVSVGYLFSRYRVLLFADQKSYVSQWIAYGFEGLCVLCESGILLVTGNYLLYLICHLVISLLEDFVLRRYVRGYYRTVDFSGKTGISPEIRRQIRREMLLLQPSNIAGTLLRTADNFLIVWLFGVGGNGIYSNYNMLLNYASMFSVTLVSALSASVGNLGASASEAHARKVFSVTCLAGFFPVNICASLLCVMSGDMITLWLGKGLTLPVGVSCVLAAHFFVSGMRRCTLIFRDAYGLYRKEKIKPFAELFASMLLSVLLGRRLGIGGVYLGQLLASFTVCFWYEPYILFRYGFGTGVWSHYRRLAGYMAVTALSCYCSFVLCRHIPSFSLRFMTCISVAILFFFGAFAGSKDLKELLRVSGSLMKTHKGSVSCPQKTVCRRGLSSKAF